jgi:hypothetical protein
MTQYTDRPPYPAPPAARYSPVQYPPVQYSGAPYGAPYGTHPLNPYGHYPPAPRMHSGLGVISTVMGALTVVGLMITFVAAAAAEAKDPGVFNNEEAPATILVGSCVILAAFVSLIGAALGIGGMTDRECRKVFAVVGMMVNAAVFVILIGLIVLGAAAK